MRPVVIALLLFLGACTVAAPAPLNVCPSVKQYSPAETTELRSAIAALPADSILITTTNDLTRMRAETRACIKATNK